LFVALFKESETYVIVSYCSESMIIVIENDHTLRKFFCDLKLVIQVFQEGSLLYC